MTTHSSTTHLSIISRAKQKDSIAWNELVQLYGPLVAHWCGRGGLDHWQTVDTVQDVFLALVKSLHTYQPQRANGSFRAWLWTITGNKIRDELRRGCKQFPAVGGSSALDQLQTLTAEKDRSSIESYPLDSSPAAMLEEPTDEQQKLQLMSRALQQIRTDFEPKTWRIFERAIIDGLSNEQIAEEFQISAANVRQVRSRILRRLRQQLGDS